ncbi:hypothetical protein A3E97_05160 [Candidatus Uhrbacteria bacterium RIFCSPHIGHO2_12_FULL_47_12]|nr:MAG: hypothetical protein A3E97_05160 [Candidatus Uhrbacteria bacterium RIFCSPHIGHO2_12_FULL_47_12]
MTKQPINLQEFLQKRALKTSDGIAQSENPKTPKIKKKIKHTPQAIQHTPDTTTLKVQKGTKSLPKPANPIHTPQSGNGFAKEAEYLIFIEWIATPSMLRSPKTQQELAGQLKVDVATLSDWKKRKGFWDKVEKKIAYESRERHADVMHSFYMNLLRKGQGKDVLVWLQYIFGFNPKVRFTDETSREPIDEAKRKEVADALIRVGMATVSQANKLVATTKDGKLDFGEGVEC